MLECADVEFNGVLLSRETERQSETGRPRQRLTVTDVKCRGKSSASSLNVFAKETYFIRQEGYRLARRRSAPADNVVCAVRPCVVRGVSLSVPARGKRTGAFDKCRSPPHLPQRKLLLLFRLKPVILTQCHNIKEEQVLLSF